MFGKRKLKPYNSHCQAPPARFDRQKSKGLGTAMNRERVIACLSERLDEMRQRFSVQKLALFGSAARDEITEDSDIDVLVVFEGKPTFDGFMDLKFYLEDLLGRSVDLVTDKAFHPQIRSAIEEELIHVA